MTYSTIVDHDVWAANTVMPAIFLESWTEKFVFTEWRENGNDGYLFYHVTVSQYVSRCTEESKIIGDSSSTPFGCREKQHRNNREERTAPHAKKKGARKTYLKTSLLARGKRRERRLPGEPRFLSLAFMEIRHSVPFAILCILLQCISSLTVAQDTRCGCQDCTSNVLNNDANGQTCRERIDDRITSLGVTEVEACTTIAFFYPLQCGPGW